VQAGLTTSLDVEQAVAASEQTAGGHYQRCRSASTQTLHALAVLTGRQPGALQRPASHRPVQVPQPRRGDLALALPAETLRQRPDVRAVRRIASAQRCRAWPRPMPRAIPAFKISGAIGPVAHDAGHA
jgi:multidrug efflux system outer membrane protein